MTDTTSTSEGASTFTSISTPPIQGQLEQLAKEPPLLTQAEGAENEIKKGMFTRMRKPRGTVDSALAWAASLQTREDVVSEALLSRCRFQR